MLVSWQGKACDIIELKYMAIAACKPGRVWFKHVDKLQCINILGYLQNLSSSKASNLHIHPGVSIASFDALDNGQL